MTGVDTPLVSSHTRAATDVAAAAQLACLLEASAPKPGNVSPGRHFADTWNDAIVETFLTLLSAAPDTHVARRGGEVVAADVSQRARAVLAAGGVRSAAGRRAIEEMDRALRGAHNTANPGTAADLTAAATFVVLLGRGFAGQSARRTR